MVEPLGRSLEPEMWVWGSDRMTYKGVPFLEIVVVKTLSLNPEHGSLGNDVFNFCRWNPMSVCVVLVSWEIQ